MKHYLNLKHISNKTTKLAHLNERKYLRTNIYPFMEQFLFTLASHLFLYTTANNLF